MTRFEELRRGDRFTLPVDADGHEPVWVLLDAAGTLHDGAARTTAAGEGLTNATEVVVLGHTDLADSVTELERVALTLMSGHGALHPVLAAWVQAILDDADEARGIHQFAWENRAELADVTTALGFAFPSGRYDHDVSLFGLILEARPAGGYGYLAAANIAYRQDGGRYDAPLLKLAHAVVDYRNMGRPTGDHTYQISGTGLAVTTSIAAQIVEYHNSVRNLDAQAREEA